jgi:RecA/RadA recombinase
MASLAERMIKSSVVKGTTYLGEAKFYKETTTAPTSVPMINVALSGNMDEGITGGAGMIAGPSKHFKTLFGLILVKAFLDKHPDSVCLFYNNEFGSPKAYFESLDIDTKRVIEVMFKDVEILKQGVVANLDAMESGKDKVIILIDSLGMVASRKELDDVRDEKVVGDMTRAKQLKAFWRIVTTDAKMKNVPIVAINHTYQTQETYSKTQVSGGTGGIYASDWIWVIGKQQEKGKIEVGGKKVDAKVGSNFIINIEKSRFVKEGTKIPVKVLLNDGLSKWSGLFDLALQEGYITSPSLGWYSRVDRETGEVSEERKRKGEIENNSAFWTKLFAETDFKEHVKGMFTLGMGKLLSSDTVESDEFEDEEDFEY